MRIGIALLAGLLAAPASLSAQATPKTPFGRMAANVNAITEAGEMGRWHQNVGMWEIIVSKPAGPPKVDVAWMTLLLERMKENVLRLTADEERERWLANIELWSITLAASAAPMGSEAARLKAPFELMKANVAAITEPGEKARWTANRDLWQGMVERANAAGVNSTGSQPDR